MMEADTDIGGRRDAFPHTHGSAVRAIAGDDEATRKRACESIIAAYWKPVYKYLRVRWRKSNEDAKDLTQAFFAVALDKHTFQEYDPKRAKFRTFLRTCLDRFTSNEQAAASRDKRGGGRPLFSLDFDSADTELQKTTGGSEIEPESFFRTEWIRGLFAGAVESLRLASEGGGRGIAFKLFQRYDLDDGAREAGLTYQSLAEEFGLSITQVTNHLHRMRAEFRRHVLDQLRSICASDAEFREEARLLLGSTP